MLRYDFSMVDEEKSNIDRIRRMFPGWDILICDELAECSKILSHLVSWPEELRTLPSGKSAIGRWAVSW